MLTIAIGLLASACLVISSFSLDRKRILFLGILINAFNGIQYLLLDQVGALSMVGLGLVMSITAFASLKWTALGSAKVLAGFLIAYPIVFFASGATVTSWIELLPLSAMMIATTAFFMRNIMVVKLMFMTVGASWIIFQAFSGAYGAIPGEIITFTGNLVSVIMLAQALRRGEDMNSVADLGSRLKALVGTRKDAGHKVEPALVG